MKTKSRVLSALLRGGSVNSVARSAAVDPELVRIAIDHRQRLGLDDDGCGGGACPATAPVEILPMGCRGCPLMSVRRA